jgi:hypothetical protein
VADLLVTGDRIVAIERDLVVPSGADVVDGTGQCVVPGFIDNHMHTLGGGGEVGPSSRGPRLHAARLIACGITCGVGLLGADGVSRRLEDLYAHTLGLREEGMGAYMLTGSYDAPPPTLTGSVQRDVFLLEESGLPAARSALLDGGVSPARITVSSDGGGMTPVRDEQGRVVENRQCLPSGLLRDFRTMASGALGIARAAAFFTANVADAIGLERQRGRLAPGMVADMLLLGSDLSLAGVIAGGAYWEPGDARAGIARRRARRAGH